MEPLKLGMITKKIIWGGERLAREYGKGTPGEKIAESWELTDRADGVNTIVSGTFDGMLLSDYLNAHKDEVKKGWDGERFPLLIKLIDAEADLSIQVHPDDEYAAAHTTDLGKTEMWYIVDAAPDARIIYGLKKKYSAAEVRAAIENGTLEELMNYVPVKKGETYFIPSGMVHAICRGILIAEIQQNSNITYRVYDYNRRGADGKLRELHVDDALAVIDKIEDPSAVRADANEELGIIAKCGYFTVYHFEKAFTMTATEESFVHLLCLGGEAVITWNGGEMNIKKGESVYIPAGFGEFAVSEGADIVVSTL
ncbi:MAG: class I mannose-6-phosphate isomerase [Clostridia bacterium]|nr:class I mannose-6-phosphate isomerase [Clostridia bacterium]